MPFTSRVAAPLSGKSKVGLFTPALTAWSVPAVKLKVAFPAVLIEFVWNNPPLRLYVPLAGEAANIKTLDCVGSARLREDARAAVAQGLILIGYGQ